MLSRAFVRIWRLDPWSGPGMTYRWHLWRFVGAYDIFRQKNKRTKVYHWFLNILANEFAVCSLINVFASSMLSYKLFFCRYEHRSFVSYKNVVLSTYKLVCMMNVWQKWHELVHVRGAGCSSFCILMFFCSFVFLIVASSLVSDSIPGPCLEWRHRWHMWCLAGGTCF